MIALLSVGAEIQFLGLDLERPESSRFLLSRKTFVSRLTDAGPKNIMCGKMLISDVEKIKTFSKSHVGKLLWLLQTRFDLSFSTIQI